MSEGTAPLGIWLCGVLCGGAATVFLVVLYCIMRISGRESRREEARWKSNGGS